MVTGISTLEAKRELGTFLRSRRERLTPAQVALPQGGRRRTPGLRREEVALLAGVGVTWYTWLEQGRDIHPSPAVLEAIAEALRLDLDERDHLWLLATGTRAPGGSTSGVCEIVTADHLALLADLMPLPAYIQTAKYDILASNACYRFLIDDLDAVPIPDRNCMVRAFLYPSWARSYENLEEVTSRMVARLHASHAAHLDDPSWTGLITRLQEESSDFNTLWNRGELAREGDIEHAFRRTRAGRVRVRFNRLWLDRAREVSLTVLRPTNKSEAAAFAELAAEVADKPVVSARPTISARLSDSVTAIRTN